MFHKTSSLTKSRSTTPRTCEFAGAQKWAAVRFCGAEVAIIMSYIKQMFETHPVNPSSDHAVNIECITASYACAEACNACADACLGEKDVSAMVRCIRDCNDCADVC